jgi:hypothetical protein
LKKVLALAVAAGVIAAAGIGIGLSQFAKPVERAPASEITPTTNTEQQSAPIDEDESERPPRQLTQMNLNDQCRTFFMTVL